MRLKEIKPGMVIHCKTEEELKTLLDELTVLGYVWWGDGAVPNRVSFPTPILINTYFDSGVGKNITYSSTGEKKNYTEFSSLIIPELSAKEVLETMKEICKHHDCQCHRCSFRGNCDPTEDSSDKIIDICTKWREEHPKEEKKELETEWVDVVRIIKVHDNGKKECVHEVDLFVCSDDVAIPYHEIEESAERELKDYVANHKGNYFATLEHICRIKE